MPSLKSRVLVVTDRHQTNGRPLLSVLSQALRAGARAIQLRERDLPVRDLLSLAHQVHDMAVGCGSQLLINDRIDVALALEQEGPEVPVTAFLGSDRERIQRTSIRRSWLVTREREAWVVSTGT